MQPERGDARDRSRPKDPPRHVPVLLDEVLHILAPQPGQTLIDGTVGAGGHAAALLGASPSTHLVGLDLDPRALATATQRLKAFGDRAQLIRGNYRRLPHHLATLAIEHADAVLLDLGMSSLQLDDARRGFGFRRDGPLDMRMDPNRDITAASLVNHGTPAELVDLLRNYGEERFARRIVEAVCRERSKAPIETTSQLANIVRDAIPRRFHRLGSDPATKAFQALRIAVNDELGNLDDGLPAAWSVLRAGGLLAVISFHSLEDRRVKRFLRQLANPCTCPPGLPECVCGKLPEAEILTPRPIRPTAEEIARNPRARSARLRVGRKLP